MTAPMRRNGMLVSKIKRSCEDKRRYPDEFVARASGQWSKAQSGEEKLYIYRCRLCRGWHLTKVHQNKTMSVDYEFPATPR